MKLQQAAAGVAVGLVTRQDRSDDDFENERFVPFWYTKTGVIVKWSLFLGLLVFITLYLLIGYTHAKKRIRKGLPPLAYHRFLVSRAELARVDPRYAYPHPTNVSVYPPGEQYGMHYMPPPPVYDPNAPRPPMYDGRVPEGIKVDPSQAAPGPMPPPQSQGVQRMDDYEAPPGPPPGAMRQ